MDRELNVYTAIGNLDNNQTATAAALDLIGNACAASDNTDKEVILEWAKRGSNLTDLRDKIKESASG